MSDNEKREGSFGGPTFFLESADGLWGEFLLPEGKRIENNDSFNIKDCVFLGVFYRRIDPPTRPPQDATPEQIAEYRKKQIAYGETLEREDLKMTIALGGEGGLPSFISLLPVTEAILPFPKEV